LECLNKWGTAFDIDTFFILQYKSHDINCQWKPKSDIRDNLFCFKTYETPPIAWFDAMTEKNNQLYLGLHWCDGKRCGTHIGANGKVIEEMCYVFNKDDFKHPKFPNYLKNTIVTYDLCDINRTCHTCTLSMFRDYIENAVLK